MKTSREILLAHHRAAEPKLDAIRQVAVAAVYDRQSATENLHERRLQAAATMVFQTLWHELVLPSRRIWAGLAAVWVLIFAVNVSQRDHSTPAMMKASSATAIMTFRDQQKLLNELLAERAVPLVADRPKPFSPKPRSEIVETVAV